jgi:hypothetical protein
MESKRILLLRNSFDFLLVRPLAFSKHKNQDGDLRSKAGLHIGNSLTWTWNMVT